jgi:hypothetical protein
MKIRVKPSADASGNPKWVPKAPRTAIRRVPGEPWPRGAIAADGESLTDSKYLRQLIKSGDIVECEAPQPQSVPTSESTLIPASDEEI